MSRYIEYHDICSAICNQQDGTGMTYEALAHAMVEIQLAPNIEIIRCGECKYWKSTVQMPNGTEVKCLYGRKPDDFCSYGSRSEKPNNCEHITEDGVTCVKYPACDDCIDNPLNKVKGSKRLVKGKDEPTGYNLSPVDKDINVRSKDEPQTCSFSDCDNFKNPDYERCIECKRKQIKLKTEQTERSR